MLACALSQLVCAGARLYADELGIPRAAVDDLVTADARAEYEAYMDPAKSGYATLLGAFKTANAGHSVLSCLPFLPAHVVWTSLCP